MTSTYVYTNFKPFIPSKQLEVVHKSHSKVLWHLHLKPRLTFERRGYHHCVLQLLEPRWLIEVLIGLIVTALSGNIIKTPHDTHTEIISW